MLYLADTVNNFGKIMSIDAKVLVRVKEKGELEKLSVATWITINPFKV